MAIVKKQNRCLILLMVVPDSGFITFNDKNIIHDWKYRSQIGYMPQIGRYPDNMTIAQVVDMMKDIRKKHAVQTDETLIEALGLRNILNKRMDHIPKSRQANNASADGCNGGLGDGVRDCHCRDGLPVSGRALTAGAVGKQFVTAPGFQVYPARAFASGRLLVTRTRDS